MLRVLEPLRRTKVTRKIIVERLFVAITGQRLQIPRVS